MPGRFLAAQLTEDASVPEEQMVGQHADGVIGVGVQLAGGVFRGPAGLFWREVGDGGVDGHEPLGLVVGGAQLLQQRAAQGVAGGPAGAWAKARDPVSSRESSKARMRGIVCALWGDLVSESSQRFGSVCVGVTGSRVEMSAGLRKAISLVDG